jgi:hypothetical protein
VKARDERGNERKMLISARSGYYLSYEWFAQEFIASWLKAIN